MNFSTSKTHISEHAAYSEQANAVVDAEYSHLEREASSNLAEFMRGVEQPMLVVNAFDMIYVLVWDAYGPQECANAASRFCS